MKNNTESRTMDEIFKFVFRPPESFKNISLPFSS